MAIEILHIILSYIHTINKGSVSGFSSDSGQGIGKPTPPSHWGNMNKLYKPYPFCEEEQGSNRDRLRINFLGYKNDLVPWGGPVIWSIQ